MSADRRWALAAAAVWLVGAVAIALATRSSFYYADDYLNFQLVRESGLSWQLLQTGYFGTFAPGHRLLDWTVSGVVGLSWTYAVAVMLVLHGVSTWAMWRLCRTLAAAPVAFAGTALVALSPVWVRTVQWWANGAHVIPATAGTLLALAAGVAWSRSRRPGLLVAAGVAHAAALCFYTKPVLVPLYLALLLCVVRVGERLGPRSVLAAVRRALPLLLVTGAISVVYLVAIRVAGYSETADPVPAATWWSYLKLEWLRGASPLLVGQTTPPTTGVGNDLAIVGAQVLLAVLVVVSVLRRPAAWRAWAAYVVFFLANVVLVGLGRLSGFGPELGLDPRYNAEFAYLLPLTVVLALSAPTVAGRTLVPAMRLPHVPRRAAAGVVAAGTVALTASAFVSFHRIDTAWDGPGARAYVERLEATAARLPPGTTILDGTLPYAMTPGGAPPFDQLGGIAFLLDLHGAVVGSADPAAVRRLAIVDGGGAARPTALGTTLEDSPKGLADTQRLDLSQAGGAQPGPDGRLCLDAAAMPLLVNVAMVNASASAIAELTFAPGARGAVWAYAAPTPADDIAGPVAKASIGADGRVALALGGGADRVRFDLQTGGRGCLQRVRVRAAG